MFKKLKQANLRLKPSKCEFFKERIEYLNHIVSKTGIETNPKKIEKVKNWPQPRTITDLQGFLGLCNYYRKFIEGFNQKARPLYKLLMGLDNKALKKKGGNIKLEWMEEHEVCPKLLKEIHTNTPVC